MKTNWLANIFTWIHEVISEADKPISLVVMVLLPFISPLLPALITADSLQKFMQFDSSWSWIAVLSFEMIGYLGMIFLVGAMMRVAQNTDPKRVQALTWNRNFYIGAYATYLATLLTSNVILEIVNGVSLSHVAVIFCLTIGLSISAGILNGSRIQDRNERDDSYIVRQEQREDRMKARALKAGINIYEQSSSTPATASFTHREKHASDYEDRIISMLETEYARSRNILSPSGICHSLKIDVERNKGHVFRITKRWKENKSIAD